MNKAMRKELDEVIALLNGIDIDGIEQTLVDLQQEEQDKYDNLSEGLQAADKGLAIAAASENMQAAIDAVGSARDALEEVLTYIEQAQE